MTEIQQIFISNLRRIRIGAGLSQSALAERCSLSPSYIAELESGRRFPSHETMDKLCGALDVRPYMLFFDPEVDHVPLGLGAGGESVKRHVRRRLMELLAELD